ncbi:hypothetical protein SDC9_211806 [bioreactor metagenome]|uniref:SLH domain-containing protein n=1 Tax=bioreactor metagenome TaxID=1076179 RepID=A0A645JK47_9ZZZZ
MVTTLYRMEGEPAMGDGKSGTFIDVPEYVWYTDAVEWTAAYEIVMGYGDGTFGPDDKISREQLAAMLYRYAEYKDYDVSVSEDTDLQAYADASAVSEYAVTAMQWAMENGIITGRTADTLNPKDTATRAELATILMRFTETFTAEE